MTQKIDIEKIRSYLKENHPRLNVTDSGSNVCFDEETQIYTDIIIRNTAISDDVIPYLIISKCMGRDHEFVRRITKRVWKDSYGAEVWLVRNEWNEIEKSFENQVEVCTEEIQSYRFPNISIKLSEMLESDG